VTVSRDVKSQAKEYAARRDAALQVTKLAASALARETAIDVAGAAMRTPDAFTFDPVRATLGLATHAERAGARIFEQSPVVRVKHLPRGKGVQVKTAAGVISADAAVIATGSAGPLVSQLRRHFITRDSYMAVTEPMPAVMRRSVGLRKSAVMDSDDPPRTVRWLKDDRILVSGADQPAPPARLRERALTQRTGQLMYELSVMRHAISGWMPEYSWDVDSSRTIDGVPYYGPHRNYPHHYFAFSGGPGGLGLSFAAARIILRHYQGTPDKGDEPLSFTRIRE
jgi:glycine/D-amino acid oxidase-like deaminating enzyme